MKIFTLGFSLLLAGFAFAQSEAPSIEIISSSGVLRVGERAQTQKVSTVTSIPAIGNGTIDPFASLKMPADSTLLQKLIALYNSSRTPFPVEKYLTLQDGEFNKFKGCMNVDASGNTSPNNIYFYKYRYWIRPFGGPLDPGESKTGISSLEFGMGDRRSKFIDGVLHIFYQSAEGAYNYLTYSDRIEDSAYVQSAATNGAGEADIHSLTLRFRSSSGFLILQRTLDRNPPTYGYCWE